MHFKIDPKDRIYFIFSSSMRFEHDDLEPEDKAKLMIMQEPQIFAPYGRVDKYSLLNSKVTNLRRDFTCLSCRRLTSRDTSS
jgi:hypothetical protein